MKKTKTIALIGILSALYVVFSLSLKIPTGVGNISLDLGYVVLAVACYTIGPYASLVGGIGAALSSLLTSAYGFSPSWTVMNFIIGLLVGCVCLKTKSVIHIIPTILCAVALGVLAKTGIECYLYNIPFMVKLPKATTAFLLDTVVMICGLPLYYKVLKQKIK